MSCSLCGGFIFAFGVSIVNNVSKSNIQNLKLLQVLSSFELKDSVSFLNSISTVKLFVYVKTLLFMMIFVHAYDLFKGALVAMINYHNHASLNIKSIWIRIYGLVV